MSRKRKYNHSRRPNVPQQHSQPTYSNSPYGTVVPFLQINNKKHTTPKPNALLVRNFSKNNAIVRRCINIIKDRIVSLKWGFNKADINDPADYTEINKIFTNMLKNPNDKDNYRTFIAAITEDLVSGDCGAFEIGKSGNPQRPIWLWSVDGYSIEFILGNDVYSYAQKQSQSITDVANGYNYSYFTDQEICYLKKQVFSNNPFGLSPIESAFEYIRALTNTFNYSADIASNALPKYLANIKGLSPDILNAYRAYFEQECMGTPNLPMVSGEGVESVQIAPISEEATFRGYQEFVIGIIANEFGVPPEKVAVAKSNDRSTIDQINENLLAEAIKPYAGVIEEAINKIISLTEYKDKIVFGYIWEDTLTAQKDKADLVRDDFKTDIVTINEIRKLRGYPPLENEYGNMTISEYKAVLNEKYNISGGFNGQGSIKDKSDNKGGQ